MCVRMSADRPEISVSDSEAVQIGEHNSQNFYFGVAGPPLRAEALLEHVRELAPEVLEDRETELAELRDFCFGDESYAWWEGDPWSGKTALLATFVLKPPAGVGVLHFFVRAGQSFWSDSMAVGLARNRRPIRAQQLLAEAFALGEWTIPLHGLVVVAPDVVRALVTAADA